MTCHVCGAPMRFFRLEHSSDWSPLWGAMIRDETVTACSVNPAHDTGSPFLERILCEMAWD